MKLSQILILVCMLALLSVNLIGQTTIESSTNPALFDQPVTITAHVTAAKGYPGSVFNTIGAVMFMDGATPLDAIPAQQLSNVTTFVDLPPDSDHPYGLRRYDVSITTSRLTVGAHAIWVSYSGDTSNRPATSSVVVEMVQTPELTILTSPNPSIHGNTVTIVAAVDPSTCTGTVTFFDEWQRLGTATIDPWSGRALLQTAALPVGNHPITVKYNGDGNCPKLVFGPANNFAYSTTSQTVNPSFYDR